MTKAKAVKVEESQVKQEVCDCDGCRYDRKVEAQLAKLKPEQQEFFLQMYNDYMRACIQLQEYEEEDGEYFDDDYDSVDDVLANLQPTENTMFH
jgi:hypothetical protein